MVTNLQGSTPAEFLSANTVPTDQRTSSDNDVVSYVINTKRLLRNRRIDKQNIWDECWQLYRGLEDWSDKDDWQSRIVIPKVWSSVKQSVSVIKRLLMTHQKPWGIAPRNQDDIVEIIKSEKITNLTKTFMDMADYVQHFAEGLESGFITGVGLWKLWWGLNRRTVVGPQQQMVDGRMMQQVVRKEIEEGKLFIRAVDPYNFFWLPGSRMNKWTGTIEEIEVPRWELLKMAQNGLFDLEVIKRIKPKQIDEAQKKEYLRHQERKIYGGDSGDGIGVVKITEYYGPIIEKDEVVEEFGHVIIANDTELLKNGKNENWFQAPPYIGFSPLGVPFRTDGVGVVEMVRQINKSINKIANLSVDTLLYKLLPIFEVYQEVYENPEDFDTGLTPGKIFRRNAMFNNQPGIQPIPFEDVSAGALQVGAVLDRAHQEGSLISEIQQAIPRYRGVQTATEIETKQANQDSFFGSIAAEIEENALKPMVEMAMQLILQFIATSQDPRVASILGVDAAILGGMSQGEILEIIQGDYKIEVTGITDQLEKAEMLQNLVQLMNIIGQNPQAWVPYINQDVLLRRILESFRPVVRDVNNIIADPETQQAKQQMMMQQEQIIPALMQMAPQLMQMQQQAQQQAAQQQQAERDSEINELSTLASATAQLKQATAPKGTQEK